MFYTVAFFFTDGGILETFGIDVAVTYNRAIHEPVRALDCQFFSECDVPIGRRLHKVNAWHAATALCCIVHDLGVLNCSFCQCASGRRV